MIEESKEDRVECVRRCVLDDNDICIGCGLSLEEIKAGRVKFKDKIADSKSLSHRLRDSVIVLDKGEIIIKKS